MKATQVVHWPGKDVYACDAHAQQLKGVAEIMGFHLSFSPCDDQQCDGPECSNCTNKTKAERPS